MISIDDVKRKGFVVLHGLWGGSAKVKTLVGTDGKLVNSEILKRVQDEGWGVMDEKWLVGYLAFPNVGLKNDIPDRQFFGYDQLIKTKQLPTIESGYRTAGKLHQSVTKSQYIKNIERIKELLADGEIYQLVYSIRFRKKFEGNPYALFYKLTEVNPVDFAAYLDCGDFQIISSSPERFFKVKNGRITTTPIKGTIKKSKIENRKSNLKHLLDSEKERAELDMITDLERNDVGKVCEYGTLKLKKEREVLELKNLYHTYSVVEGRLGSKVGPEEVISAMFPGGSITGCPKKRAMEYISLLENKPRNIFTGSIGLIKRRSISEFRFQNSDSDSEIRNAKSEMFEMDFNIAIRTILIKDGYLEFWVGGGIVADSDPEKEYEECHLKAERFLDII